MGMYSTYRATSSGGSGTGTDLSQTGNGSLVNNGGQLISREMQAIPPLYVLHGTGIGGNPMFGVETWLARGVDLDMTTTGDHAITGNSFTFIPRRLVISMAHGLPDGVIAGGLYTKWGKLGEKVVDLPNTEWAKLSDDLQIIDIAIPPARREFDHHYLWLDTANGAPLKVNAWIFGDNLEGSDIRGRPS